MHATAANVEDWILAAATGQLPGWTEATPDRRRHMARVATLMEQWATRLGLDARDRARWKAAGVLHDTLRDAEGDSLRSELDAPFAALPASMLHGPAAAARLGREGAQDGEVLDAIRYHTIGHADAGRIGLALIAADHLEPGRHGEVLWRTQLRARMPEAFDEVVRAVVRAKLLGGLERDEPLMQGMVSLWNRLAAADA